MKKGQRDELFMREAIKLARKGMGYTSPNPVVGAVIVKNGKVVGKGYHRAAGKPHAEVNAIKNAGPDTNGATLYVTLEPCNHYGRTPPCTKAILEAGIRRVVVGMKDPNPHVTGGGCEFLRKHGVEVTENVLERECRLLNQPFLKRTTHGIPYVILKAAMTLDGYLATRTGHSKWITNRSSRSFVHRLRFLADCVCVGIGTVLADDPMLNNRLYSRGKRKKILRVVLDRYLRIPEKSQLVKTSGQFPLWVFHGDNVDTQKTERLRNMGIKLTKVSSNSGKLVLRDVLEHLGNSSINSILVEGGSRVFGSFFKEGLVDIVYFFYAPKILGDSEGYSVINGGRLCNHMTDAFKLYDMQLKKFYEQDDQDRLSPPDILVSGRLHEKLY